MNKRSLLSRSLWFSGEAVNKQDYKVLTRAVMRIKEDEVRECVA